MKMASSFIFLVTIFPLNSLLKQLSGVHYTGCRSAVKCSSVGSYQRPRQCSKLPPLWQGAVWLVWCGWRWQWLPVSGHLPSVINFNVLHRWRGHIVASGYALSGSRRVETSPGLLACTMKENIGMDRESCRVERKLAVQTCLWGC